ncbi:hypothetical protein R3P38DRAFT_2859703 [Favolaschia claudopus]|uniref:Uncharacterized protein n=1 Tax=Favolaschia claudopus TaxID=2862362 RepID=A0AAW0DHS1_9AGAR
MSKHDGTSSSSRPELPQRTSSSGSVSFLMPTQPEPLPRQKKAKRKMSGMPEGVTVHERPSDRNMEGMKEEEEVHADGNAGSTLKEEMRRSPTEDRIPESDT